MTWETRITTEPGVLADKPIVKGTRLAVDFILRPAAIDRRPAFFGSASAIYRIS